MMAALSSIEILLLLYPENKQDGQEGCKKEGAKKVRNMLESSSGGNIRLTYQQIRTAVIR